VKAKPAGRPVLFVLLLIALAASLARVAFIESHLDEDACMAIGWLLSKGWRLYSDVFTHHTPLDYLPASLLAGVFGPSETAMRAFMIFVWAAAAAAVYAALRRREAGARTAVLFALLSSQWLTYWYGQMMLVENYWGYATAGALALLASPLGLEPDPSRGRAAALGALIALILTASPVCLPVAALLALWAAADARWRGLGPWAAAGAAGWLAIFGAWAFVHADLGLLWTHVVVFNRDVYARFCGAGASPIAGFWRGALESIAGDFASAFAWRSLEGYFEGLMKLVALGWIAWSLAARRPLEAAWKLAFLIALRSRPEHMRNAPPFHAAPFYLASTLVGASALAHAWGALGPSRRRRAAFAAAAAAMLLPTLGATSLETASLRPYAHPDAAYESVVAAVRACTAPEDRAAAFPFEPRFYLDAERLPAAPGVFYLPWQDAWEPQRRATLAALARERPKVVLIREMTVWGVPWSEFGAGIIAWLKTERYASVVPGAELQLFVRRDAAPSFVACARRAAR